MTDQDDVVDHGTNRPGHVIRAPKGLIQPDPEFVDHPAHYGSGADDPYEAIKVMEAWGEDWRLEHKDARPVINLTQTLKYLRRHSKKGKPIEDLAKADWFLSRGRAQVEGLDPNDHLRTPHQQRVEAMMEAFGQEVRATPAMPDHQTRMLRARLILEEALETINALGFVVTTKDRGDLVHTIGDDMETWELVPGDGKFLPLTEPDLVAIADGCADLSVVATGTLSVCGIADRPLLELVDRNNMEKAVGGHRDQHGKWQKPEGHEPPDVEGLIERLRAES